MLILRTPKGWTGPKEVDGLPVEGTWRSHQVPLADVREQSRAHRPARGVAAQLPAGRALRRARRARPRARAARAARRAAHEREPARERRPAPPRPRPPRLPRLRGRRGQAGHDVERGDSRARRASCATSSSTTRRTSASSARTRPRRTGLGDVLEVTANGVGGRDAADRRGPRAGGPRGGDALRAPVPGLARGLPAHRPARALQLLRGVHPHRRLDVQPAREVAEGDARDPVAAADRLAQLPAQLARLAPGPQRLLAPGSRASSTTS